jgi:hypothetical protein
MDLDPLHEELVNAARMFRRNLQITMSAYVNYARRRAELGTELLLLQSPGAGAHLQAFATTICLHLPEYGSRPGEVKMNGQHPRGHAHTKRSEALTAPGLAGLRQTTGSADAIEKRLNSAEGHCAVGMPPCIP